MYRREKNLCRITLSPYEPSHISDNWGLGFGPLHITACSWQIILGSIHTLRKQRAGWVGQENGRFLLMYGWIRKGPKLCWRNIWMVPYSFAFGVH